MTLTTSTPEQAIEQVARPPLLTLTTAAETAQVSRSTLRRRLNEGAFPGAQRDATGQWLVPVMDLIAAGLTPMVTPPTSTPVDSPMGTPDLPERIAALEAELEVERTRRDAAERLAVERLDRVEDLRMALRAIGPAPAVVAPPRRRWWRRRAP